MASSELLIATDFDGTLTLKDVGNELSEIALGARYRELQKQLRAGALGLKEYQRLIWENFPMNERDFRAYALEHGELRDGVEEFLETCAEKKIPVYVASCGLRPYIEEVLSNKLSSKAQQAILDLRCNEVQFDAKKIATFTPPSSAEDCPYPLDKGAWAQDLSQSYPGAKIIGIGNGTSDRSFWGKVDTLAATEGLARWCEENRHPYIGFESFKELLPLLNS